MCGLRVDLFQDRQWSNAANDAAQSSPAARSPRPSCSPSKTSGRLVVERGSDSPLFLGRKSLEFSSRGSIHFGCAISPMHLLLLSLLDSRNDLGGRGYTWRRNGTVNRSLGERREVPCRANWRPDHTAANRRRCDMQGGWEVYAMRCRCSAGVRNVPLNAATFDDAPLRELQKLSAIRWWVGCSLAELHQPSGGRGR